MWAGAPACQFGLFDSLEKRDVRIVNELVVTGGI